MSIVGSVVYNGLDTPVLWPNSSPATEPIRLNLNGGLYGKAHGINNLGQIVGEIYYAGIQTPVYWATKDAVPTNLLAIPTGAPPPPGTVINAVANGINNVGQIVGSLTYQTSTAPIYWANSSPITQPEFIPIPVAPGITSEAYGINTLGNIVGLVTAGSIIVGGIPAFWTSKDALAPSPLNTTIGGAAYGINNLEQIVGNIGNVPVYWLNSSASSPITNLNENGGANGAAYGINISGLIVGVEFYGGVSTPVFWANNSAVPSILNFGTGGIAGIAYGISDQATSVAPVATSNICFPAGTPVNTDQGIINIELLDKNIHTLNSHPILHITKTKTLDKYLISFEKNTFGRNVPNAKTIMTKDHKIVFEGKLVPAYRFLTYTDQVKKVKYSGETLYNVLLGSGYGLMKINDLVCETLHPDNIIAKLYTTNYSDEERSSIVYQMNTALLNNDVLTYKAVVDRLTLML